MTSPAGGDATPAQVAQLSAASAASPATSSRIGGCCIDATAMGRDDRSSTKENPFRCDLAFAPRTRDDQRARTSRCDEHPETRRCWQRKHRTPALGADARRPGLTESSPRGCRPSASRGGRLHVCGRSQGVAGHRSGESSTSWSSGPTATTSNERHEPQQPPTPKRPSRPRRRRPKRLEPAQHEAGGPE